MDNITFEQVNAILKEQNDYFSLGETRNVDFRLMQLTKLKKAIKENEEPITEALYKDLHKSKFEAYATEIGYLLNSIGFMTKNLKSWAAVKKVKTPIIHLETKSYICHEPLGTVLIIGPFNYPFQLIMEPLIGAIAAGNCAVLKPSEYAPNVSAVIEQIICKTFDKRYVAVVKGGKDTTSVLINSNFNYIFFTGSASVGKVVMEAAAKKLVPVTLELGGKSPCIVDRDANLPVAAKRIAWGKFINAGQTCVAPDYLMVHTDIKDEFLKLFIEAIKEFYGDDPKRSSDFGRIINARHVERLIGLLDRDKILYGGEYDEETLYISPTIMDNITWNDRVMEEEIFGPILPIMEYDGLDSVIRQINAHAKPLAFYIFTENREVEKKAITNIPFGGGCINDTMTHLATPYLPFGGIGASGIGSYHGKASFLTFSNEKSIMKKGTRFDLEFLYPPYSSKKLSVLKRVFK